MYQVPSISMTWGVRTPSQSQAALSLEGMKTGLRGLASNVRKSFVHTGPILHPRELREGRRRACEG